MRSLLRKQIKSTFVLTLLFSGISLCLSCNSSEESDLSEPKDPTDGKVDDQGLTIKVVYGLNDFPDVNIKRGFVLRGAVDRKNNATMDDLQSAADIGMEMVLLPRDFNQFNVNWESSDLPKYYRSYRSQGNQFFGGGGEPEEFIRTGNHIEVSVNPDYLDLCREAISLGMTLIIQYSGSPVAGLDDGTVTQIFDLDPSLIFHESARFYALPDPAQIEEHAEVVFSWMKALDDELGRDDMIWLGQQEPYHTPGYPGGTQTNEGSIANVFNYARVWKPIAERLSANGMTVGGLQMNEVRRFYEHAVDAIVEYDIPTDVFSIQNYFADRNALTINEAIAQLDSENATRGKQILFNRYNYHSDRVETNEQKFNTAIGVIEFLKSEVQLIDYADRIYGYNFFTGAQGRPMLEEVLHFLNDAPKMRLLLEDLPEGIQGYALGGETLLSIVLWNESSNTVTTNLKLSDFPDAYEKFDPEVKIGSGEVLSSYSAGWDPVTSTIQGLELRQDEFMIIQ